MKIKQVKPYFQALYLAQILEFDIKKFTQQTMVSYLLFKKATSLKKGRLIITPKILFLLISVLSIQALSSCIVFLLTHSYIITFVCIVLIYGLTSIYFILLLILIIPFDSGIKYIIANRARKIIKKDPNLIIIAVTGCYGKTSTIAFIKSLLEPELRVFTPKQGFNTLIGIASQICKYFPSDSQVLLLELGDYKRGEIAQICKYFSPNISLITSIGTQHLERFKTIENLTLAKFEIIDNSQAKSTIILSPAIKDNKFLQMRDEKTYLFPEVRINSFDNLKTHFTYKLGNQEEVYYTSLLGEHIIADLSLAICTVNLLLKTKVQVKINQLQPIHNRLSPSIQNTILYLDDTYNIGVESADAALNLLQQIKQTSPYKRLIVCTGGIVEQGTHSQQANEAYGKKLSDKIDLLIIYNTPYRSFLINGFSDETRYLLFETEKDFFSHAKDILKPFDCVLQQNDIPDQYYLN